MVYQNGCTNEGFHMTQSYNSYWQRNLLVCFIGSFSTVFAMTLMLPSYHSMLKSSEFMGTQR
ncbi:major facilitator superfamily protein [Klebsiella variicola]|nr:major facilitator superfamily protein [Klebsiella variicola]